MPKKEIYIKTYKQTKEFGSSLSFDGVNDFVEIAHNAVFNLTTTYTLEAWCYFTSFSAYPMIVTKCTANGGTNNTFELRVSTLGIVQILGYDTALKTVSSIVSLGLNTWYHLAVVKSGGTATLYVNGMAVGTGAIGTTTTNTNPVYIGARNDALNWMGGRIQDVRIWNVARTQAQIQANRNLKIPPTTSGLVANYYLNEGTGTTATDVVAGRNGTLFNFTGGYWGTSTSPIYNRVFKGFTQEYAFNSINSNVNAGYGDVSFSIPRKFDDSATRDLVGLDGYELDVVAYDNQQNTGQILFSGEIVKEDISMSNTESVEVTAIAPIWRLEKTPLVSGGSYTVSYSSVELATIFRNIIDIYNSQNNFNQLNYTASSIATTGISRTLNFNNATCLDALKSVYKLTNTDWVWFIDVDRVIYLKQLASIPTHYFFVGKDVVSIKRTKDKTTVVNNLLFWNGETSGSVARKYANQASIDSYGLLTTKIRDNRYSNTDSINSLGARTTTVNANPNVEVEIEILDSSGGGYDLESIKVGDTCKILNIGTDTGLDSNMVITSKQDKLDSCVLRISDKSTFVARELYDIKKVQEQVNYEDGPATYV